MEVYQIARSEEQGDAFIYSCKVAYCRSAFRIFSASHVSGRAMSYDQKPEQGKFKKGQMQHRWIESIYGVCSTDFPVPRVRYSHKTLRWDWLDCSIMRVILVCGEVIASPQVRRFRTIETGPRFPTEQRAREPERASWLAP